MTAPRNFLILSGHDYRTARRVNVHFIAAELAKRGKVRAFSLGFSLFSYIRNDARLPFAAEANRVVEHEGVSCFLWKTPLHPIKLPFPQWIGLSAFCFRLYRHCAPDTLRQWIGESDTIILESGMPPIFIDPICHINPHARKIYLASDLLETIGCDPFIIQELNRGLGHLDEICVPSRKMAQAFSASRRVVYVPHGLDPQLLSTTGTNPYGGGINAVSVGSMLFDADFFDIAALVRPDITFHVIGGGHAAERLRQPNVRLYGEMPHQETLRYIKHAHFGIAPYIGSRVHEYLCDTSMKLMQYRAMAVPAICPHAAVGNHPGRFGYTPGDGQSVAHAIEAALACKHFDPPPTLTWSDVTDRILEPNKFPDTAISLG
jgi:2-beta-glucuronyltransferase